MSPFAPECPPFEGYQSCNHLSMQMYYQPKRQTQDARPGKIREMGDLRPAFRRVAEELSSQYSIGYYPRNLKHDGKFHGVEVTAKRPGLLARTRKGYVAS